MSDLIDRQAAINTVHEMRKKCNTDSIDDYEEMLTVALGELCTAQRTGRWEIYVISMLDGEGCKCSECGFEGVPYWDFCPNCGARMEDENEAD